MNAIEQARAALRKHSGNYPEIARRADVSYSWICKFAIGKFPEIGAARLQRLTDAIEAFETEVESA